MTQDDLRGRPSEAEEVFNVRLFVAADREEPFANMPHVVQEQDRLRDELQRSAQRSALGQVLEGDIYVDVFYRLGSLELILVVVTTAVNILSRYKPLRDSVKALIDDLRAVVARFFHIPRDYVFQGSVTEGPVMVRSEVATPAAHRTGEMPVAEIMPNYLSAMYAGSLLVLNFVLIVAVLVLIVIAIALILPY